MRMRLSLILLASLIGLSSCMSKKEARTESPQAITAGIVAGIPAGHAYRVEHDRGRAIHDAVLDARPQDVVMIAGKGHEDYQLYGRERRAFSDQDAVRAALAARLGGGS